MSERFLNDRIVLHAGDCREVLVTLPENSLDACVTDPPYHLTSIVKRMSADNAAPVGFGSDGRYQRLSGGFMGKAWDGGDVAFRPETWAAVLRVLKPGAWLVAMSGTRTYHRMACAIEDAGFVIYDQIAWCYGSGFPKSHDISKAIDRAAGIEREIIGEGRFATRRPRAGNGVTIHMPAGDPISAAGDLFSSAWDGWGTALKPAWEPICLARKPLSEGTIAANVLRWGTGGINIDGCRVNGRERTEYGLATASRSHGNVYGEPSESADFDSSKGRWPANLVHDGSAEVVAAFPESTAGTDNGQRGTGGIWSPSSGDSCGPQCGDSGSAARFFYTAKADTDDRLGSKHPTVKPLDLMHWLVRLVTPPRGTLLDPFAGTGTTGEAAWREGMSAVLIEAEAEYQADIRRRMALALAGPDERTRETIKAKGLTNADPGPLFAHRDQWAKMWARPFDFDGLKDPPG